MKFPKFTLSLSLHPRHGQLILSNILQCPFKAYQSSLPDEDKINPFAMRVTWVQYSKSFWKNISTDSWYNDSSCDISSHDLILPESALLSIHPHSPESFPPRTKAFLHIKNKEKWTLTRKGHFTISQRKHSIFLNGRTSNGLQSRNGKLF